MATLSDHFDIVIENGRVMDPQTGFDGVRNVGVKDGKIVAITDKAIAGAQTFDATGHVVAPGFIDGHCHAANDAFGVKCGIRDGKTTHLDLELGAWPVAGWYDRLEGRSQANYGTTVGHLAIRDDVFSNVHYNTGNAFLENWKSKDQWSVHEASPQEMEEILEKVEQGPEARSFGCRDSGRLRDDRIVGVRTQPGLELAGEHGLFATVHGRFSSFALPTEGILGTLEAIASASMHGAGILVHHWHAQVLSAVEDVAKMADQAREKGVKILLEAYPYTYGSSILTADYLRPENYGRRDGSLLSGTSPWFRPWHP